MTGKSIGFNYKKIQGNSESRIVVIGISPQKFP